MPLVTQQQYIPFSDVADRVQQLIGHRPHLGTIHRWATKGVKGVKLRSIYACGARRTTEEWIKDFFQSLSDEDESDQG